MLPRLEVAIAPTKNIDRIEWALEKLTEIGMTRFSLVITEHTIRRRVNMERLERIVVSAMKQSEKLRTVEPVSYTHLRAHETSVEISYAVFCLKKKNLRMPLCQA